MTGIIIGLLAALGIGGGIALSGHGGGGGGGNNDSGYVDPVQPVISLLAVADKYQHVRVSDYGGPSIGDGIFAVTGERPVVENGKFKIDESYSEIEDVYEPYSTTLGLENYSYSDAYADYYQKDSFVAKGLYNTKEYPGDADNWIEAEAITKDELALGGQVLGLKNSEFGYHNNITTLKSLNSSQYGELPEYKPFYMYDDTKLATIARTDTALYKGNVLGYVEAENSSLEETLGEDIRPLTGNINLNINFANQTLNGSLDTKLSNKNWYGFNVSGYLSALNSFSINSVSIDEAKHPDSALSKYNLMNISGAGGGKLLEDDTQRELVGNLWLYGNNTDFFIHAGMSFGAVDTSIPQGDKPGGEPSQPAQGPTPNYNLISALSDSSQYTNLVIQKPSNYSWDSHLHLGDMGKTLSPSLSFQNKQIILHTAKPKIQGNEFIRIPSPLTGDYIFYYGIDNDETDIVLNEQNHITSSGNVNIYQKISKWTALYDNASNNHANPDKEKITVSQTDTIGVGGAVLGLSVSDFGYWKEERSGMPFIASDNFVEHQGFYVYDSNYLYKGERTDEVLLKGNIVNAYNLGNMEMELNFATALLHGGYSLNGWTGQTTFIGNLNQYSLTLTGTELGSNGIRLQGNGHLLEGVNGLEAVGSLYSGSSWFSFGLKEVK